MLAAYQLAGPHRAKNILLKTPNLLTSNDSRAIPASTKVQEERFFTRSGNSNRGKDMKEFIGAFPASGERAADRSVRRRRVLLASSRQEDHKALAALLQGAPWTMLRTATWRDTLKVMGAIIVPVMLCVRNLPGLEWPNGLAGLGSILRLPALFLLSDVTSSTLSEDVLGFGAFDVLSRPFSRESLISTLEFACIHWEMRPFSLSAIEATGT